MTVARTAIRFKKALPHPGETLAEDYLEPLGLKAGALAKQMGLKGTLPLGRGVLTPACLTV